MSSTLFIAKTQQEAKAFADGITIDRGHDVTITGIGGQVYFTHDRVFIKGPIEIGAREWDWLMRSVHLFDAREVRFF